MLLVATATAKDTAAQAASVIARMARQYAGLRDYSVGTIVRVDIPQIEMPDMALTAYYRAPDKTALRARGFAMVPEQGVFLLPSVFGPERFTPQSLAVESTGKAQRYHLVLRPKPGVLKKLMRSAQISRRPDSLDISDSVPDVPVELWVDPATWSITRVHAHAPKPDGSVGFVFDAAVRSSLHYGYRLPDRTTISVTFSEGMPQYTMSHRPGTPPSREEDTSVRMNATQPVRGRVILTFTNYKINAGVPDDVFQTSRR
jgi:hypothetical protein